MSLIENLKNNQDLQNFFCSECSENNISVNVSPIVTLDNLLIIKVDDYYNKSVVNPLPSPDCLIIQQCSDGNYNIYIVELKNIDSPQGFSLNNIVSKFITCLDDFMNNIFGVYFNETSINYNQIKLLFVSDPYAFKRFPNKQLNMKGHKLDALMSIRIPKYFNHHLYIEHKLPDPIINPC
jgi:hypothetical protein